MSTGLPVFDTTVNETNGILQTLQDDLLCSRQSAYAGLRAVLHALRDRLAPADAVRLAAQMPLLVRGMLIEGWRPDDTPVRTHTAEAFVERVVDALPADFDLDPTELTRAVIAALWWRTHGGALEKARAKVPADIRELWPQPFLAA